MSFSFEKNRVHILISGRVQGVFFRRSIKEKAEELEITGWVSNVPDGRVEAVLEGAKENVDKMLDWAKEGPISARVESVEIVKEQYTGVFDGFEIK